MNSEGMTVIIATPDAEVANYCRRVVRIENGVTTDDGLVERRRIIRLATTAGPTPDTYVRRVQPTPGSQLALFASYSYHGCITDRQMLELEATPPRRPVGGAASRSDSPLRHKRSSETA